MINLQLCGMIDLYVVYVRDFMLSNNIQGPQCKATISESVKNMDQNCFLKGCNIFYMH